ncbi:serine/threonine protein kinase, partial [Trifolium pratense]
RADIWSFGITALELAHGHAPFSKKPPSKVLRTTFQSDGKFSKLFKQMIAACLVEDHTKRPSANKLLEHSFFKQASSSDNSQTLLEGLAALGRMKEREEEFEDQQLVSQKREEFKDQQQQMEKLSRKAYRKEIKCWNFNLEDMVKAHASLINDIEDKQLVSGSQSADMEENVLMYKAAVPTMYQKAVLKVK